MHLCICVTFWNRMVTALGVVFFPFTNFARSAQVSPTAGDFAPAPLAQVTNTSGRAFVQTGDNVMIGGLSFKERAQSG
jgi:hypothetical protein